jgi:serine/threonine-protein kinase ULK3
MKKINKGNPNVVRFIDNFVCSQSILIVMEYCPEGTLQDLLDKEGKFQEEKATYYLKEIINGFKGLHEINVIHRDFKA